MKLAYRIVSLFLIIPFLCSAALAEDMPAPAAAAPKIYVMVNGSKGTKIPKGWPILIETAVMHPDGKNATTPLAIESEKGWMETLRIETKDASGNVLNWPFQLAPVLKRDPKISLDAENAGLLVHLLSPDETKKLAPGKYTIKASYVSVEGKEISAGEPVTIQMIDHPEKLSDTLQEFKDKLMGRYLLLMGETAQAAALLARFTNQPAASAAADGAANPQAIAAPAPQPNAAVQAPVPVAPAANVPVPAAVPPQPVAPGSVQSSNQEDFLLLLARFGLAAWMLSQQDNNGGNASHYYDYQGASSRRFVPDPDIAYVESGTSATGGALRNIGPKVKIQVEWNLRHNVDLEVESNTGHSRPAHIVAERGPAREVFYGQEFSLADDPIYYVGVYLNELYPASPIVMPVRVSVEFPNRAPVREVIEFDTRREHDFCIVFKVDRRAESVQRIGIFDTSIGSYLDRTASDND